MNDIWLFQAFGDEVYTNSDSEALLQAVRSKIIKQSRKNARNPYLIFGCSCQCVSPILDSVIPLLYDALIRLQSLLARWFAVNLILICHSQ